jgi:hypothetical protein
LKQPWDSEFDREEMSRRCVFLRVEFFASNFRLIGSAQMPAYSASKHGVAGLTKSAALEVAEHGIRCAASLVDRDVGVDAHQRTTVVAHPGFVIDPDVLPDRVDPACEDT